MARATVTSEHTDRQNAPCDELDSLEEQVTTFLDDKMGIQLSDTDVSICYTLPGKKDTPNIVVRLTSGKVKNRILKRAKYLKGTNVYVNEHLTAKHREIAATTRKLRKDQKIINTWTRNCQIFIRLSNGNGNSNIKMIREMKDFSNCSE